MWKLQENRIKRRLVFGNMGWWKCWEIQIKQIQMETNLIKGGGKKIHTYKYPGIGCSPVCSPIFRPFLNPSWWSGPLHFETTSVKNYADQIILVSKGIYLEKKIVATRSRNSFFNINVFQKRKIIIINEHNFWHD